jgi:transcriptional regulator with XRE-family HTH domain
MDLEERPSMPDRHLIHRRQVSPEHVALGRAVRELRVCRRMSQEELGYRGDLHRNYVGALERGEINPTFRVLLKVERGLSVPLTELTVCYERQLTEGW